mmetsp:Transcript_65852/g.130539  ORF Transcript_65852/g.130539 Transcript_65852/m.130539 type:complete len:307 (-) Transcript_65852:164-1084(-)
MSSLTGAISDAVSHRVVSEAEEMADLLEMMEPTGNSKRESATTASKYNRWLTGEQNRQAAAVQRAESEALREARAAEKERVLQYVAARKQEAAETKAKQKALKEQILQANLSTGTAIKKKAAALKATKEHQDLQHMEKGRAAADRDEEQRRKIRDAKGDAFKQVAEQTARAKQKEIDSEFELARARAKIHAEKQAKVSEVRRQTGEAVLDASKEFVYMQRKALAASQNAAAAAAKDERKANEETHLEKAKANKAAAHASRAAAREKREAIIMANKQHQLNQSPQPASPQPSMVQMGGGSLIEAASG